MSKQNKLVVKINELLEKGIKDGFITQEEVDKTFEGAILEDEQLEQIYNLFNEAEIEIIDTNDDADELIDMDDDVEVDISSTYSGIEYVSDEDSLKRFMREMGQIDMVNMEKEIELAKLIKNGQIARTNLLRDFTEVEEVSEKNFKKLFIKETNQEVKELLKIYDDGVTAKKRLAEANLRLVVSIAKRYMNRGMMFLDLIQEGNVGLLKAIEKYDHTKGFKFSTYATWWIRQAITRSIADQSKTIRIPMHIIELTTKYLKTNKELINELGREPTLQELSNRMQVAEEKILNVMMMTKDTLSLDTPLTDDNSFTLSDTVKDDSNNTPEDVVMKNMLKIHMKEVLETLTDRERLILIYRYGLEGNSEETLEQVGNRFNVTRERIRQIESKAVRKLRHPSRSKKIREFL